MQPSITLAFWMKIEDIDINDTVEKAKKMLKEEKNVSPAFKVLFNLLLTIIGIFIQRVSKNSKNSSKPPSADPNREKAKKPATDKKPGGQTGHVGKTLEFSKTPDEIVDLKVDRKSLPKGQYEVAGYDARQVVDIKICRVITEYRAQILQNERGKRFTASFPKDLTHKIQYGATVKAQSVYLSGFQMIPYNRIVDYFADQMKIPVSAGSCFNFNKEAYDRLEEFEGIVKKMLINSARINSDETGINIGGKRKWLHTACNDLWAHYYPHDKRGSEAMDEIGILPNFAGILCHDHWNSYYTYKCLHALCNAHHLRELEAVVEFHQHKWAKDMQDLLCEINNAVDAAGGKVGKAEADAYRIRYRAILAAGDIESPPPALVEGEKKKRGRVKKEKHRNLLERLRNFEDDTLRFMELDFVTFTNNIAENALRMIKVQQKISGCFRSMEGAKMFCRIRSYLVSAQKHGMTPTNALNALFHGALPEFCYNSS